MKRLLGLAILVFTTRADAQPDTGWELRVPDRLEIQSGTSGSLVVSLAIDRGLAISKDAAIILDLAPEGALAVKRRRLGRADAVDPDAEAPRFQVAVHADVPGDFALKLHLRFWLCGNKSCRPIDARRTIAVSVPAPAAPPSDAGVDAPADAGRRK
ncbi:MAG: hypothetical protein JWO36_2098 [Myxococcales bacterium]|nr:hypothetical protein [Myxococcales bacterium]